MTSATDGGVPPHAGQRLVTLGPPLGEAPAVVILIHGRGAAPENIAELVPAFGRDDVTFLVPAASGGTWYPLGFMSPIDKNEPGISSGISVIHALVDRAHGAGVPSDRIVLLGFSQGGCLASTAAQRRPARYGGVVVFSGALIGPPGIVWDERGSLAGTPVFFGCSDRDAHIPEERVRASAAVFERMGAAVTTRIYPGMGHLVNDDEIACARSLLTVASEG